jgi:hypothetical protein
MYLCSWKTPHTAETVKWRNIFPLNPILKTGYIRDGIFFSGELSFRAIIWSFLFKNPIALY